MTETFSTPDDLGDLRASDLHSSLGDQFSARAGELLFGGTRTLGRLFQYSAAEGIAPMTSEAASLDPAVQQQLERGRAAIPELSIDDAKDRAKQEGLEHEFELPDQPTIKAPVLDLMIQHAKERRDYNAALSRGPQGFLPGALGFGTEVAAGIIDPVNAAMFAIPVIGEARYGMMLKSAGESVLKRTGVKALVGAGQGAAGMALLQPADWWLHTRDGVDYTMADALHSIVLGAGMGAAAHAGLGAIADSYRRAKGVPLEGSPEDLILKGLMSGTKLPEQATTREGIGAQEVPGIAASAPVKEPLHPAEVFADLPPGAREDVVRASIASVIKGEPVKAAEMLQESAKEDPRIAESVDPYFEAHHGSPHDFESFDASKVGTGEGAQSYGHGLYFAEHPAVAENYKRRLSDQEGGVSNKAWNDPELSPRLEEAQSEYDRLHNELAKTDSSARIGEIQGALGDALRRWDAVRAEANEKYPTGATYKVRIAANRERFLEWDKPLKDQPEILDRFREAVSPDVRDVFEKNVESGISGGNAYHNYVGKGRGGPEASKALSDVGIPGVRYLDQGSRAAGEGTRNYVVFDDRLVKVTHKNGEEVGLDQAKAAAESEGAKLPGAPEPVGSPLGGSPKTARTNRPEPKARSLLPFLASKGGLRPDPELAAIFDGNPFVPGHGKLIRQTGMPLDRARELAVEGGYLQDPAAGEARPTESSVNHLLTALDEEHRGSRRYPAGQEPSSSAKVHAADERGMIEKEIHDIMEEGQTPHEFRDQLSKRVIEIMQKEGESDILVAYERAVMEDASKLERKADARREEIGQIPGFDVPDDTGSAPGAGGDSAALRSGSDRAPGEPGGGARGAPREPGEPDRAAPERADWKRLTESAPEDRDLIEASKDADKTPDIASTEPTKAVSAAQAAAKDADKLLEDILPRLTEEERAMFKEALDKVENDKSAREDMTRQAMSCLVEALA